MAVKFTVITCSYNRLEFIGKALDSVAAQKDCTIQHIINDSHSTDGTLGVIQKYIQKNKDRYEIQLLQTKPEGIAKAMNIALSFAVGEYTHFLHTDDYYVDENSLSNAADHIDKNAHPIWMTGNHMYEKNGKTKKVRLTKFLKMSPKLTTEMGPFFSHENTFVKTEYIKKLGGFDEKRKLAVETRLWHRLIRLEDPIFVDEYFAAFIVHTGSASQGSVLKYIKGAIDVKRAQAREKITNLTNRAN